jgi:hypothetical protein
MIKRKGLKLKPRESKHERRFRKYAEARGCIVRKFNGRKGDPDRIVLCPRGRVLFIEFKRDENAEIRDGQIMRMSELADLGFDCALCISYEQARDILDMLIFK